MVINSWMLRRILLVSKVIQFTSPCGAHTYNVRCTKNISTSGTLLGEQVGRIKLCSIGIVSINLISDLFLLS